MNELAGFDLSGATIHFSADHPLPDDLVARFVQERVLENEARRGNTGREASSEKPGR